MAIPENYIDKFTKYGQSRMISPAADMVRVNSEEYEGDNLGDVLDEIADAVSDAASSADLSGLFADAAYNSTTKEINFLDKNNTVVATIDAKPFVRDGMVSGVTLTNGILTITFNADAGKQPIEISLGDLFAADNYYTKTDADGKFVVQVNGKGLSSNDYTDADKAAVGTIADKADKTTVPDAYQPRLTQGTGISISQNNEIGLSQAAQTSLGKADSAVQGVSVESNGDGTVDINVDNDTYTVNLNHTHENMAKLVVCEESDLPSTLDNSTIYGVEEDGEISMLYVGGVPFYGGGGGASSVPVLRRPADGATIDMGQTTSGTVSKTINVKGKSLTQALTIEISGTGYSFGTTQPSGVTRDSSTQLTITAATANTLNGVDIIVVYTGSDMNAEGSLSISSGIPDNISCECELITNYLDTDGLVAHWNAEDAVSNNNWVDRINNLNLGLEGTAARTSDGYKIDYHSDASAAAMRLDYTQQSSFNNLFSTSKEITAIVKCRVKFHSSTWTNANGETKDYPRALIIDFGCQGGRKGNFAIRGEVFQQGRFYMYPRGVDDLDNPTGGFPYDGTVASQECGISFPVGEYVDIVIKVAIEKSGVYKIWTGELGSAVVSVQHKKSGSADWPLNMIGCQNSGDPANFQAPFGLGCVYANSGMFASNTFRQYRAEVIYQQVLLYNKAK